MTLNEMLQISAVLLSPIIALQVSKIIEKRSSRKNKKIEIFKTLMASRGSILSFEHVAALNRIDLEFSDNKTYSKVIDAWKEYFDLLNVKANNEQEMVVWNSNVADYLANLLFEMGKSLGYDFNKALIKRNVYAPIGHFEIENELREIRQLLVKVLKGESPLLMQTDSTDEAIEQNNQYIEKQVELQKTMIEYYTNTPPINVRLMKD